MKFQPRIKSGLCLVCNKPTALLIHKQCGLKMDAERADKAKKLKSQNRANKKSWQSGYVPPFAKL